MPKNTRKIAIAGVATLGAAAIAFTVVPADGQTTTTDSLSSSRVAYSSGQVRDVKASVTDQLAVSSLKVEAIEAKKKAAADAVAAKKKAAATAAAKKKAAAAAAKKAAAARKAKAAAASRSANRPVVKQVVVKSYPNNLDGWIRESLAIMKKKGIPGSYHGLHKNIIRESSGNPKAINDWDINAINGIPSKGLLQVIPPTFKAYHVPGTSWNIYDPIANITAAANYAADRYGTIDNVNSAY
ncbi:transglycosylase SLT domain-containing protein [Streptomyces bobili]|uniref:transglycosylase SLT domain-containing protein n=1 Tax=Streptomyces bobili TaxID=67280 RepID=UPI002256CAF3|nr:transglycosylase SLT domain-containing protein [Streptomyces bobili]MCX5523198.1 transglycosylase SLT domain-containing protein [Streptomyces bobili]